MYLADVPWTDADAVDADLAVLPVGSTEQHGPHAPLGTDTLTAEAVTAAGVEAYAGEVVVAPTLPVGVAEEHRQFTGSLWLRPDTFRAAVRDVVGALAHHGWRRVVIVNGHGGNVEPLREVTATISRHDDAYAVAFTWFKAVGEHASEMGHAGRLETAMLRARHPELVREDRIEAARSGASDGWGEWVSAVDLAHDSAEFTRNGVVGDPAAGDADLGAELEAAAGRALAELLAAVAARDLDRPPHR